MAQEFASDRYDKMPYRRCGDSGLKLPLISLGFWQALGEQGQEDECRRCAYFAFDHGITHFDLANNYGPPPGNSERVLGQILKDMPRDELIISTKAGFWMWNGPYGDGGSRKYLIASLDQSLKRLGLDYVDIFYHHRPDDQTPLEETLAALDQIVRQGKALYAGVSNYPGHRYNRAVEIAKQHDWAPITIHQPYYNMRSPGIETDLLPYTKAHGTGVIAFCPLAGGDLTDRYLNGVPPDSRQGKRGEAGQRWWQEQKDRGVWDRLGQLNDIAKERGQTLAQMALAWVVRLPTVTSALIGASNVEQIKQNVGTLDNLNFTEDELTRIAALCRNWP
ncbi:MAG: aldo/keto reductase [Armatimonadetes bacterium]|nr:aldo/keto reductase [Armatimonadota bacterium]